MSLPMDLTVLADELGDKPAYVLVDDDRRGRVWRRREITQA